MVEGVVRWVAVISVPRVPAFYFLMDGLMVLSSLKARMNMKLCWLNHRCNGREV